MSFLDSLDRLPGKMHPAFRKLSSYNREILHFACSILLIGIAHALSFVHPFIPFGVGALLIVWMTYQEFYLHPKKYKQKLTKSIVDWLVWCVPFILYLAYI